MLLSLEELIFSTLFFVLGTSAQKQEAGCVIEWKETTEIEFKDVITTVCTTEFKHACKEKTIQECKYDIIKEPLTETVDQCTTENVKSCKKTWACNDEGWVEGTSTCENEVYNDTDECTYLPQTVCNKKDVTIYVEKKERVCEDIKYKDCTEKAAVETCEEDHTRIPETYKQSVPFKRCTSD